MQLWKLVFGDSAKFIRLFFERVYSEENALVIEENGRIVSALHILPYRMMFCGEEISVAYISGACTLPSEQGKGLMKKLLENAFEEMERRNIAVSALIPAEKWLFNFYRAHGYTEVFEYSLKVYTRHEYIQPEEDLTVVQQKDRPDEDVFNFFDRKLRERPACILHTNDDLVTIIKDLKLSKGKLFVAYNATEKPVGMAFVYPNEKPGNTESIFIKEILYDSERAKKHLLFKITKHYKVCKAVYRMPYKDNLVTFPYGMARVIDQKRLIDLWLKAHPDSNISTEEMQEMDVNTLTSHLFDYAHKSAYMSLMLD